MFTIFFFFYFKWKTNTKYYVTHSNGGAPPPFTASESNFTSPSSTISLGNINRSETINFSKIPKHIPLRNFLKRCHVFSIAR